MSKYPGSWQGTRSELGDASEPSEALRFPVAPDFLALPPRVAPEAMLRRLEETMAWLSTRPGERERRRTLGIPVEFVL